MSKVLDKTPIYDIKVKMYVTITTFYAICMTFYVIILTFVIICKSLWIKASAKWQKKCNLHFKTLTFFLIISTLITFCVLIFTYEIIKTYLIIFTFYVSISHFWLFSPHNFNFVYANYDLYQNVAFVVNFHLHHNFDFLSHDYYSLFIWIFFSWFGLCMSTLSTYVIIMTFYVMLVTK